MEGKVTISLEDYEKLKSESQEYFEKGKREHASAEQLFSRIYRTVEYSELDIVNPNLLRFVIDGNKLKNILSTHFSDINSTPFEHQEVEIVIIGG